MLTRALGFTLLVSALLGGARDVAADQREIALTVSFPTAAGPAERDLGLSLLTLLELRAGELPELAVVERMQIDLALDELVRNRALNADEAARLQLGRLIAADLIVTTSVVPPEEDDDDERWRALVRVVEAQSGVIRGVTAARLEETLLDDVAGEIARYLAAVATASHEARTTIAVGAFESASRFDRLRPLETGLRDLLTRGLLRFAGFHVLQRADMQQLNRELELIRGGLADPAELPATVPTREAAYLLRGTIDETFDQDQTVVTVNAELLHAGSGSVVQDLRVEARPDELPDRLAHLTALIAGHLMGGRDPKENDERAVDETAQLSGLAYRDLARLRRRCPIDFSVRRFRVPGAAAPASAPALPPVLHADSLLGRHLLKKSIDRLESIRFLKDDAAEAAYALGFCYSFYIDGISDPDRADSLLRAAYAADPTGPLAGPSLRWLAELSYHHRGGHIVPSQQDAAAERIAYAFRRMPDQERNVHWSRLLERLAGLAGVERLEPHLQTLGYAARLAETGQTRHRRHLSESVTRLAKALFTSPAAPPAAEELLLDWAESDVPDQSLAAARALGDLSRQQRDLPAAARWYERGAEICAAHPTDVNRRRRANLLMHAGRSLRKANEPARALELLTQIEQSGGSLNDGYVNVEIGACYEDLQQSEKALEHYLKAASAAHLVDNRGVAGRIQRLGGVPLDDEREIDVTYIPGPDGQPYRRGVLATDGRRLFCGGGYNRRDVPGVAIYDISRETWEQTGDEVGRVTCLVWQPGHVWAGSAARGLWRYDLATKTWRQWTADDGLPDQRIVSLTLIDGHVYAGVGSLSSGGLIRVERDERITVFDQQNSPRTAVTHVAGRDGLLFARTGEGVFEYDPGKNSWRRLEVEGAPYLFAGDSEVWASDLGRELYRFDPEGEIERTYRRAWFSGEGKAGYRVRYLIERDGQLWFGGAPWRRFTSAGFYRVDRQTGAFTKYGPRDGFRLSATYATYSGVAAANRLWLTTSAGLAVVDPDRLD